jgi:hypothetical protein
MNVRPEAPSSGHLSLSGSEGELILVSIAVEPRLLEALLDTLGGLSFPVNPEIFHAASIVRVYVDGRREAEPATIVDFPAYAGNLLAVKNALAARGFPAESLWTRSILEGIHSDTECGPAPEGAPYVSLLRIRRLSPAA